MQYALLGADKRSLSNRNVKLECDLLRSSGLFDKSAYRSVAPIDAQSDPVVHYVEEGWREGLEPNPTFPGSLLQPYFEMIGLHGPPAVTGLTLRSARWPLPGTRIALAQSIAILRDSKYFDEAFYVSQLPAKESGINPISTTLR